MKRIIVILLLAALLTVPALISTASTKSVALSHEPALTDMGVTHAAAVEAGGHGYAWGFNYNGAVGNGVYTGNCPTPYNFGDGVVGVSTNGNTTLYIDMNGSLWVLGNYWFGTGGDPSMPDDGYFTPTPRLLATDVRSASMGSNHLVFVKNDNSLWVYGENGHGQLGNGTTNSVYTPTRLLVGVSYAVAGDCLTAAVKTDGTLWVWGFNGSGQVGNNSTADRLTPVQVLTNVYTVSTMGEHVLAIKNDNTLWAWGSNVYGQLGTGNTTQRRTPVQVMTGAAQVSAGFYHTGVIKTDGTLWFCGNNYMGAFGNGTSSGYSQANASFTQTAGHYLAVSCGLRMSAVISEEGRLLVAGDNTYGQLGLGFENNPAGGRFFDVFTPNGLVIIGDERTAGDVNADGVVDFSDVSLLRARLDNIAQLSEQGAENADMDRNGRLNENDLELLLGYILNY